MLVPVIKDMNRRADEGTQSNITAFFDGSVGIGAAGASKGDGRREAFAPRKRIAESSKRMGTALSRMADKAKSREGIVAANDTNANVADDNERDAANRTPGLKKKVNRTSKKSKRATPIAPDDSFEEDDSDVVGSTKRNKQRRK